MKNKLFVYACSHGKLGTVAKNVPGFKQNDFVDSGSFGDKIAKKLNLSLVNRSSPGSCNFRIFSSILKDMNNNEHSSNDLCIVQWSHIDRVWSNSKHTLMPHIENEISKIYYSDLYNDLQNFAATVGFNLYVMQKIKAKLIYSFADHISTLQGVSNILTQDVINLGAVVTENMTPRELVEYRSRTQKDLFFPCCHSSELGHELISQIYISAIENSKGNNIV
jgi:hypothetical protein